MPAAVGTAEEFPFTLSAVEPGLVPHHDAQRSPNPAVRLRAQALSTLTGLVPCGLAVFWSVTRRMETGEAVVLQQSSGPVVDLGFCGRTGDPFAPSVAARTGASVLTVEDVGGALRLANTAHGRQLRRLGLEHQVALYLRAAGGVRAMIALFRARDFHRAEVRMLRLLQPLIEQAHAGRVGAGVSAEPALPALTRREAEVAALIALGASNAEIATAMNVEQSTVKTHLTQIYAKFGVRSRIHLALQLNADALPGR